MPPSLGSPSPSPTSPQQRQPLRSQSKASCVSLGKLLALSELHFPHQSSEGLGQGKRVHLDEPCCVLSPDFSSPKSPGCQEDWCTLMSPEAQTLFPVLPASCLTSTITRQNSHPPHHLHCGSRTCCVSHCWLLSWPEASLLSSSTTHHSSHSSPARKFRASWVFTVCPTPSLHPNPTRALLYPLSFPLLPLKNSYSFFKAQNSSLGEAHSRQTNCSVNTVPEYLVENMSRAQVFSHHTRIISLNPHPYPGRQDHCYPCCTDDKTELRDACNLPEAM